MHSRDCASTIVRATRQPALCSMKNEAEAVAFTSLNRLAHDIRRQMTATYFQDAK